jgi:hypothetical protein
VRPDLKAAVCSLIQEITVTDTSAEYEEDEDEDPDFTYDNNIKSTIISAIKKLYLFKRRKNTQVQAKRRK